MRKIVYDEGWGALNTQRALPMYPLFGFESYTRRDRWALEALRKFSDKPEIVARAFRVPDPDHTWLWPAWLYALYMQVQKENRA